MHTLLLLLVLVPAPKIEPPKLNPLIGAWSIDWTFVCGHTFRQTTFFNVDGTCDSPEYESGTWVEDADGYIWFSERNGKNKYVMRPDWESGTSSLWSIGEDGMPRLSATLRLWRGEYLHNVPPREIEQ